MKTFAINTLGCKVNQYESQQIRQLLESLGLRQVESLQQPDLFIINTCCVTGTASAKSRQQIRSAQKSCRDALILVCGCLPTVQINELENLGKNARVIAARDEVPAELIRTVAAAHSARVPESSQPKVSYTTIRAKNAFESKPKNQLFIQPDLPQLTSFKGHTRAFLKVQDGCDGWCSYCIIPRARPNVRSKPADQVLEEAQALVGAGHKEIVITGIFLGAYGQTSVRRRLWQNGLNDKLAELLEKLGQIRGLARIRLSSLEPGDVTPRLVEVFCGNRNFMPHLHLSLQSGSSAVLRRMCRQYTADDFMGTVELINSRMDRPAITADIIVGFPGETDSDFMRTVEVARRACFAKMHVFRFSARKGTAAASMKGAVSPSVIRERARMLQSLDIELAARFRQQFVGETAEILTEHSNGRLCGRSERYFMVHLEETGPVCGRNELVTVRLISNSQSGMVGRPVRAPTTGS